MPGLQARESGRLETLRREAADCRACPLWAGATQTVFGEGSGVAKVVFVGEQPGDKEDILGRPFVGPAGQLLDRAFAEAGIDRSRIYLTNAVKHFKFEERGKRRLHKRPNTAEIRICHRWLAEEIAAIRPKLLVALGATAAQSIAGRATPVGANRGKVLEVGEGMRMFVTVHPSSLLRLPDPDMKATEYARFVADLRAVGRLVD